MTKQERLTELLAEAQQTAELKLQLSMKLQTLQSDIKTLQREINADKFEDKILRSQINTPRIGKLQHKINL